MQRFQFEGYEKEALIFAELLWQKSRSGASLEHLFEQAERQFVWDLDDADCYREVGQFFVRRSQRLAKQLGELFIAKATQLELSSTSNLL